MFITRQTHALYGVSVKVKKHIKFCFEFPAKAAWLLIFFIVHQTRTADTFSSANVAFSM